jgi:GDP-L-fucose synthase
LEKNDKIYVAGHRGLAGSAIVRKLRKEGFENLLLRTSTELDLRNQQAVQSFFEAEKPAYVFLAAAKVGGIHANNTYPAEFLYDNLCIESNVIHQSYRAGVKKLLFLGSSCIYPKNAPQPIKEEYLLSGYLESTNEAYAIAKIAGMKLCQYYKKQYGCNFISAMPTNLYGPGDNYDLKNSHVLPALLRKFHEAKESNAPSVTVWGTGKPRREFLHSDDLASACFFLMQHYDDPAFVNIGTGKDISIGEMAHMIKDISGYEGEIVFDTSMPDGTFQKLLDVSKLHSLGWKEEIGFEQGVRKTYEEKFA